MLRQLTWVRMQMVYLFVLHALPEHLDNQMHSAERGRQSRMR